MNEEKNRLQESTEYSAESIQVLEGLEAVRRRPAMYIGDIGIKGLHHLVYEVVDNSIDEALAGYCTQVSVTLNKNGSVTVIDNGRGIPVDIHKKYKKPAVEIVMTMMFLLVILGATDNRAPQGLAPVAIGLCLTLIHLVSIPVTNTSVNPARSTAVALFAGGWAIGQLWLFWVAPIVGGLLAAAVWRMLR
jgi:glycerol uptake facilitator-like aquaporin